MNEPLPRAFYRRDAVTLAQALLGTVLVCETESGAAAGRIVETEAYMGEQDPAAHSYKRREGGRTSIQYDDGGYAYIYFTYGMHYCMNVVANVAGIPECVLIRALEPLSGIPLMESRRNTDKLFNLCSGPGKLCAALGIDKTLYGADLTASPLRILTGDGEPFEITASRRIGIKQATDRLWRFSVTDSPFVSVKKFDI